MFTLLDIQKHAVVPLKMLWSLQEAPGQPSEWSPSLSPADKGSLSQILLRLMALQVEGGHSQDQESRPHRGGDETHTMGQAWGSERTQILLK